jgi:hypothetical protein
MATQIIAGNATDGLRLDVDNTGALEIKTGSGAGTTAVTVDTSQNVLVGTTSTSGIATANRGLVEVNGSTDAAVTVKSNNTVIAYMYGSATEGRIATNTAVPLTFFTNNTERMRIASDGVITSGLGGMQVISGTAVTASTTAMQFTGIPSWVKRITIIFNSISYNANALPMVQIGSGSFATSGYAGMGFSAVGTATGVTNFTTGFTYGNTTGSVTAATLLSGVCILVNTYGNVWVASGSIGSSASSAATHTTNGNITLGGVLDRVQITSNAGTATFDNGNFNILYE